MANWNSLDDIMQDLSEAQGCAVPASLEIYTNSGPPQLRIPEEESDEQSYYGPEGGGDFTPYTHPDYELIQHMLNMVKEKDTSDDDDPSLRSDLDPLSSEYVPQKVQRKIKRNVALSSILTTKNAELAARRPFPKDVVPSMFKRKTPDSTRVKSESVSPLPVSSPEKCNQFTPTTQANEYYNKYLEKSKLREQFENDIWSQAELKMKEIDARRKAEAEVAGSRPPGLHIVELLQHRHQLSSQCVVCSVASKHGYDFKDDSSR